MSRKRRRCIDDIPIKRGPNGRRLCTYCRKEVQPPRITFCSDECVHQHCIRSRPGYAAEHVFLRDCGICAVCGIDTVKRQQDARLAVRDSNDPVATTAAWKAEGWPKSLSRRWFDVDHIIPVVEGGGECGLDNLRTLCCPCHKKATKALAQKRAQERKAKKHEKHPAVPDPGFAPGGTDTNAGEPSGDPLGLG